MSRNWQRIGAISSGGSVMSVCTGPDGRSWLATGSGILTGATGNWRPLPEQMPMEQVGLVAAAGPDWFLAGLSGGLILTWDGGRTWASAWIDEIDDPIACISPSATYGKDITLLAGTVGAGVLRSTDGGRRWRLSNFGLEEFSILALTTAGDWSRRQVVFAGTADGIYRSSGGGRAWKVVGLRGFAVQSLAAGHKPPTAARSEPFRPSRSDASGPWTILAGTESNGLYKSADGGYTWDRCGLEIGDDTGINALLCADVDGGDIWLAGTDEGSIWRSADDGDSWSEVCNAGGPVLSLSKGDQGFLAGTSGQGLWISEDDGCSWRCDHSLSAWGFRRLDCHGKLGLSALAPTGGVWLSADAAKSWHPALGASLYEPVLAFTPLGDGWLAARAEGVWRGQAAAEPALVLAADEAPIVALAGTGTTPVTPGLDVVWAGAADAALWASPDGGLSWQVLDVPFRGQRLLGLALSPQDGTPLVGTYVEQQREVSVWRYAEERWQCWLSRSSAWPGLALYPQGTLAHESWAALGGKAYVHTSSGWQDVEIPAHENRVSAFGGLSSVGEFFLLSGSEVVCRTTAAEWQSLPLPEGSSTPIDLCISSSGVPLCLDAAGAVWRLSA
jgi:hypothetical protein